MAARRDDATTIEDQDAIGLFHRRQPMRHDDCRPVPGQALDGLLDRTLALGVERGGCLVQKKDRRIAQDRASDGDPLLLPTRQHDTPLSDIGVIALRQDAQELVRCGGPRCGLDLGIRGAGAAERNILARRGREDHRVLRHERHMLAEISPRHIGQVMTVDGDPARIGIVKPQQKLDDSRLARPRWPHERDGLARFDGKGYVIQRRRLRPRRIVENYILEGYRSLHDVRTRDRLGLVLDTVFGGQEFDQTFRCPGRALQLAPDLGERPDGTRDEHGVDHELNQFSDAHDIRTHVPRPDPKHAHDTRENKADDDHRHDRSCADPLARRVEGPLGHIRETRAAGSLVSIGLHRLDREQRLGSVARGGRYPILVLARQHAQAAAQHDDRDDDAGNDQKDERCQLGRRDEQHGQPADQDQAVPKRDRYRGSDDRQDQGRVGGDPAQHFPGHDLFVEGRAHTDHAVEDGLADVCHHPLA